jgi:hypothetical protein
MARIRSARRPFEVAVTAVMLVATAVAFTMTPPLTGPAGADPAGPLTYLATGDSYASGEGLTPFVDASCHRSVRSHPFLVERPGSTTPIATDADLSTTFTSLACSGAKIADLRANQLGAVTTDTDLVTVSIGGNDAGFSTLLEQCFSSTCTMASDSVDALVDPLVATYTDLKALGATVVVTGYPQLFENATPCGSIIVGFPPFLFTLSMSQVEWNNARAYSARLNDAIEIAARRAGVHFVDVESHFAGHGLCKSLPWVNNIIQTDLFGNVDPASFHPTETGQREYAAAVNNKLDALVAGGTPINPVTLLPENPAADPAAALPAAGTTSGTMTVTPLNCGTKSTAPGEPVQLVASGFNPGSVVTSKLMVNGAAVATVAVVAASNGVATTTITVPATLGAVTVPATFVTTGINPAFFTHAATHLFTIDFFLTACDHVVPTIAPVKPIDGQVVILGDTVNASYTCADDRLVVVTCAGPALPGQPIDTASVGPKTFLITATDRAGNMGTRAVNYKVQYNTSVVGYSESALNEWTSTGGSANFEMTIRLRNAAGVASVNPANVISNAATFGPCSNPTTPLTAGNVLSATSGGLNLKLKMIQVAVGQCFRVTLVLDDGTTHVLTFKRVAVIVY